MAEYNSRTKQTVRNATVSFTYKLLSLIIKFVVRYVFIYTLGAVYLGVSALFSSIITLLSLADLGFSIALPQSLYKPLAENNTDQIRKIIHFYSKVYWIILSAVLVIGFGLYPFLNLILKGQDTSGIDNINLIYILFVVQSAASYLFVYKRTLITADQKEYFVKLVDLAILIASTTAEILILFLTKNYLFYLGVSIVFIILQNIITSLICDKKYPYIKKINHADQLTKLEKKELTKNIYSLFIYKAATAVETGTDNIVATTFCGLVITGLCSNYTLITTSITQLLMMVMASATASIGNLVAIESSEKSYKIYNTLNFISFWIYGLFGICICCLINPFINVWLGSEFLLDDLTVIILCINFYISGVQNVNSTFRNAFGLFYQGRYRPVLMIIINLGSSILLANFIGLPGIFIGTLLSRLLTVGTFDPYIVHKHGFHLSVKNYYFSHIKYHSVTLLVGCGCFILAKYLPAYNIWLWVLSGIVLFVIINLMFLLLFFKSEEFKDCKNRVGNILRRKKK